MLKKKDQHDRDTGLASPLPTQIVGNEEFAPMPQSADQKKSRHEFSTWRNGMRNRSACHDAISCARPAAWLPHSWPSMMYSGRRLTYTPPKPWKRLPIKKKWPKGEFIFDAQNHHVHDSMAGPLMFRKLTGRYGFNPDLMGVEPQMGDLHRANFLKEIFFDSDTVMGLISGAAIGRDPDPNTS